MGIIRLLGSFPNSQLKPRSPVRQADVDRVTIGNSSETKIINQNSVRVKAIIKNEGPSPFLYDYESGNVSSQGLEIPVGGAINVEGGGVEVYAIGVGGNTTLAIDDREG